MPASLKFLHGVALSCVLLSGSSAPAQIKATYSGPNRQSSLVVEISDDGAMRFTRGDGSYVLILNGRAYDVRAGPGGPTVITAEAIAHQAREDVREGRVIFSAAEGSEKKGPVRYVPHKNVKIGGHDGVQYIAPGTQRTTLTLTEEATLLPLGRAFATYFRLIEDMSAEPDVVQDNLPDLLATHGLLGFWNLELATVTFGPIDRSRFAIPATPLTLADVAAGTEDAPHVNATREEWHPSIIHAVYRNNTLLTLLDNGQMQVWPERAKAGLQFDTPGRARAFCKLGDALYLVTGGGKGKNVSLWSRTSSAWSREGQFEESEKSPFLALDCSGSEPVLLTANALRLPRSGQIIDIMPEALAPGGFFTTLQHGGFLYVGANSGEWGGGLRRFPLSGGSGEAIDGSDPQKLCGGTLNMACDPVTGLAPDPARPDCILAATGLVHMMSNGSVVRICNAKISLAYAKPYTVELDWHFDPKTPPKSLSSVPFYALASDASGAWAVGSDGIYRFTSNALPSFNAFPRIYRFPASGIDWSNPEFVLISTGMNQRHSLSGSSLIIVPR